MEPHIALVLQTLDPGGAERQALQLAEWAREDADVDLVVLAGGGSWTDRVPPSCHVHELSTGLPSSYASKSAWAVRIVPRLRGLLRDEGFDALLTFLWFPTLAAALARGREGPPILWSVQGDLVREFDLHRDGWLRKRLIWHVALPRVDRMLPISTGVGHRLISAWNLDYDRVEVVSNSISMEEVNAANPARVSWPLELPGPRILSVGRLHHAKGYDVLLKALASELLEPLEWSVVVLGDGPERRSLAAKHRELGLQDRVVFAGYRSNPHDWLAAADAFVSPSRWETFGIAIAEAMAHGLPVVATRTDGARDLINQGESGWLVPPGDAEALSASIADMLTNPKMCKRRGKQAKQRAQAYSVEAVAERFFEVVRRTIEDADDK